MGFLTDQFNRNTRSGIAAARFQIMLLDASGNIGGNAGIKRMVSALDDIEMPNIPKPRLIQNSQYS